MTARIAAALAAIVLTAAVAACAPNVPGMKTPKRFDYFCNGSRQVNLSGMQSVLTSTDDRIGQERLGAAEIAAIVRKRGGAIAYWDDQPLKLPRTSVAFGEPDGFIHVRELAVPAPTPTETTQRTIYVYARDAGVYRWFGMQAFDVQDVCVEGRRQA